MALRPVGVRFVTKGFNTFVRQLNAVNKQYQSLGRTINLTGNNISAFGAKLVVFNRQGRAYSQWVDEATNRFLSHDEVQRRFQSTLDGSVGSLSQIGSGFAALSTGVAAVTGVVLGLAVGFVGLKVAINGIKAVFNGFVKLVKLAIGPIVAFGKAIKSAIFNIIQFSTGGLLSSIKSTFAELRSSLVGTVSDFQRLEIQYESLLGRQLRLADSNLNVADSLKLAGDEAQRLLSWVKQIAVTTPFEVETIAKTIAFSQAMGFTAGESKTVTEAIINFTSAMGLGQETMERIIQNFGQMRAAGKVTGTELRDLARGALLPVNDILDRMGENLGIAEDKMDEFKEAASEGRVSVDAFFKAFVDVANESFPDAAARMSRTFEGVKNNIVDFFKTVVGVEIFGPTFNRITEKMADALDSLLSPAVRRSAFVIGEILLKAFNRVSFAVEHQLFPALKRLAAAFGIATPSALDFVGVIGRISGTLSIVIRKIADFIRDLAGKLGDSFEGTAEKAKAWGFNIIGSLAQGMADAASLVINVLIQLGRIIAGWLQAKSPPKLLPDLGKWGAAAMTEYMKGWAKGDFSVFNEIAGTIENFIRSISGTILNEKNVVPIILDIRDALARAMNEIAESGEASAKAIKEVFAALKGGTPELRKYVELQLKLAEANQKVIKAQEELNRVTEKYDAILKPLKRRLDELSDRGDEFDDLRRITQLQLILSDVNASAGDKQRALIEIEKLRLKAQINAVENEKDVAVDAAQEKVDAAEKNRDVIDDQFQAQKELIQVQIDTNNLIKEQIDLLKSLADAAKGAGDLGIDVSGIGIPEIPRNLRKEFLEEILADRALAEAEAAFEEAQKGIGKNIDEILSKFDGLGTGLEELGSIWGSIFSDIFGTPEIDFDSDEFRKHGPGDVEGTSKILDLWNDINAAVGRFVNLVSSYGRFLEASLGALTKSFALIGVAFGGTDSPLTFFDLLAIAIGTVVRAILFWTAVSTLAVAGFLRIVAGAKRLSDFLIDLKQTVLDFASLWFALGVTVLVNFWNGLIETFGKVKEWFGTEVPLLIERVTEFLIPIYEKAVEFFTSLWNGLIETFESIKTWFGESLQPLIDKISEFVQPIYDKAVEFFTSLWNGLIDTLTLVDTWWGEQLQLAVDKIAEFLQPIYDAAVAFFTSLWNGMKDFWDETLLPWFEGLFVGENSIVQFVIDQYSKFLDAGKKILNGLWEGLKEIWAQIVVWAENSFGWLIELLEGVYKFKSPSKVMKDAGKNIMLGLAEGLESVADLPAKIMSRTAGDVIAAQPAAGAQSSNVTNNNFNLTMPTTAQPAGVQRAFNVMSVMAG
jgi:tape measure domain-containing protein